MAELTDIDETSAVELRALVASVFGIKRPIPDGSVALHTASKVGKLDGSEILLDDQPIERTRLEKIKPGQHRIEVRLEGFETFIWVGRVRPGRVTRVGVQFVPTGKGPTPLLMTATAALPAQLAPSSPAPASTVDEVPSAEAELTQPTGSPRVFTWLLGGTAVVATAVGILHGVQVLDRERALEPYEAEASRACQANQTCGMSLCETPDRPGLCEEGEQSELIANVSFALAGGLAAGAIVAFFVEDDEPETVAVTVGLAPTPGGAAASVRVRF